MLSFLSQNDKKEFFRPAGCTWKNRPGWRQTNILLRQPLLVTSVKKQYVGQTVDTFRYRWNNHRFNSRKHAHGISCMQEQLYEHFCDGEHWFSQWRLNKIYWQDWPYQPLQRENYWKHTSKAFAPYGLNIKENV